MAEDSTQPPHATRFVETTITTMEADPTKAYNQDDATGFIRLNGLRIVVIVCGIIAGLEIAGGVYFKSKFPFAAGQSHALESLGTNVISRVNLSEKDEIIELSQTGWWLSLGHLSNSSGWGCRLPEPQQSIFVTNDLIITLPDWWAFDLDGYSRIVIGNPVAPDMAWGKPTNGLAVGINVRRSNILNNQMIWIEAYLRNTRDKPIRVFACPNCAGRVLAPELQVTGPDGKIIKAARGKLKGGIIGCHHTQESNWPLLAPGQVLGPLHVRMFTSAQLPMWCDSWFDCSRSGDYKVSLALANPLYGTAGEKISPPAGLEQDGISVWQESASSGTLLMRKP